MSDQRSNSPSASASIVDPLGRFLVVLSVLCAMVSLLVAGLALGLADGAREESRHAEREARISQIKVEGFENALHAAGINPNPHLKGEPE